MLEFPKSGHDLRAFFNTSLFLRRLDRRSHELPSAERANRGAQERIWHLPRTQATSPAPAMAVQSTPELRALGGEG